MNENIINDTAYNYLHNYNLSMEHHNERKKLIINSTKTKFYLFKRLSELRSNSQLEKENKRWFIVEIN